MYQETAHCNASEYLKDMAEKAYHYGIITDSTHMSLMRTGGEAYKYLCSQLEGLEWLKQRGIRAIEHSEVQLAAMTRLSEHAQHSFAMLNRRETAFHFIHTRRLQCVALIANQAAAVKYLHGIAPSAVVQSVNNGVALEWLQARAVKAFAHSRRRFVAREKLKLCAGRYQWINRRERKCQAELREIAQVGKLTSFTREWASLPANKKRLLGEMQRIAAKDKLEQKKRDAEQKSGELTVEERWLVELHEAFMFMSKIMHVPKPKPPPEKRFGKDGRELAPDESSDESSSDDESESEEVIAAIAIIACSLAKLTTTIALAFTHHHHPNVNPTLAAYST